MNSSQPAESEMEVGLQRRRQSAARESSISRPMMVSLLLATMTLVRALMAATATAVWSSAASAAVNTANSEGESETAPNERRASMTHLRQARRCETLSWTQCVRIERSNLRTERRDTYDEHARERAPTVVRHTTAFRLPRRAAAC